MARTVATVPDVSFALPDDGSGAHRLTATRVAPSGGIGCEALRQHASYLRRLAASTSDDALARTVSALADDYEARAAQVEANERQPAQ